jgi:hypothetical protein
MGVFDRLFGLDKIVESKVAAQTAEVTKAITTHLDNRLEKASSTSPKNSKVLRYQLDPAPSNVVYIHARSRIPRLPLTH